MSRLLLASLLALAAGSAFAQPAFRAARQEGLAALFEAEPYLILTVILLAIIGIVMFVVQWRRRRRKLQRRWRRHLLNLSESQALGRSKEKGEREPI
jgi:hypothetical protein